MKIEDKRYFAIPAMSKTKFAEAAPSVGNFESMIAKYEALGKKMVLTSDNKKEGDEVGRQYAKDLKGLNRILQAVKSSDRKTAQQVADNMDSAATDYIPKSLYNWIYKGFSARAGTKSKFGYEKIVLDVLEESNIDTSEIEFVNGKLRVPKNLYEEAKNALSDSRRIMDLPRFEQFIRQGSKAKFASMWTDGSVREAEYYKKIMKQLLAAIDAKTNSLKANKQTVSQAYAMVESAISQKNASMLDEAFNSYDRANYAARNSFSHKGTKAKFSTRGAFAEASSSPMLGELLQKKVMPEGGWRAVETGSGAITIAFEDPDIAENFAKRCAEIGYSATRPAITAARYFNVCVSEEGKKNETK